MRNTGVRRPVDLNGTVIGDGSYLLCIPVLSETKEGILSDVKHAIASKADMLEWRIDCWEEYPRIEPAIQLAYAIRELAGAVPILVTPRSRRENNYKAEDITDEEKFSLVYTLANTTLFEAFDVEYFYGEKVIRKVADELHKKNCRLLISKHVRAGVLDDNGIREVLTNMQVWGGDIAKLCVFNETFVQFFWYVNQIKRARETYIDIPMVTVAASDPSGISRALGDVWGTDMIFVTSDGSRQPGIDDLRKFRRMIWPEES